MTDRKGPLGRILALTALCLLIAIPVGAAIKALRTSGVEMSSSTSTTISSGKTGVWVHPDGGLLYQRADNTEAPVVLGFARRVSDSAIVANTLVKGGTTAGRVAQYLTTDVPPQITGVALTVASGSGTTISIVEAQGVQAQIKSDGTTVIAPGDLVEPSPTSDGRIRKGAINPIGTAMSSAAAVADTLVDVL